MALSIIMKSKFTTIIALQALIIIVLFWLLAFYGKDEYESYSQGKEKAVESPALVKIEQGVRIVTLPLALQKNSDIKTSKLEASQHTGKTITYGTVVNIENLLDLRSHYQAAKAETSITRASANNNNLEYQRLKTLNEDDKNVSDRALAIAEATIKSDQARVLASESMANNIRDNMRQQWGDALTKIALESSANKPLLKENEVLIQILLPYDAAEPKPNSALNISIADTPNSKTIPATFISRSANVDANLQGKTYFYRATNNALRIGMKVIALSPSVNTYNQDQNNGVIVPNTAVIWYGGKAWAYLKQGTDKFTRKLINTDVEVENGWFNEGSLKANDEVVTSGAQLLLSEEFKSEIKNENTD